MFVLPHSAHPNSYVEALTPNVMVLEGGPLGGDEVMERRGSPHDGISVFIRGDT